MAAHDLKRPILYVDALQAESRGLLAFCDLAGIDFETRYFKDNEQANNAQFKALNPTLTLPFMEAEINLPGGHTIARYLAETRLSPDNHFYPSSDVDVEQR